MQYLCLTPVEKLLAWCLNLMTLLWPCHPTSHSHGAAFTKHCKVASIGCAGVQHVSEEATNPDNVTSPCQTADHFAVDFGSLHVVGPASTHSRTCVVGWPCHIAGLHGNDLQAGDYYLILDTCGLASHLSDSPAGFLQTAAGTFGSEVSFHTAVTSSGGTYRICWCAQGFPCYNFDDFRVDAGELVLQGVLPEQSFTCVRGRPCFVSHVQGVYIESQKAEFLIMATCSSNPGSLKSSALAIARALPGTDVWWELKFDFARW